MVTCIFEWLLVTCIQVEKYMIKKYGNNLCKA